MNRHLTTLSLLLLAGSAQAGLPLLDYSCPTGIELHTDEGGPAYINGEQAKLERFNDDYYEASSHGVTVSIAINPDGSANVSYTGTERRAHGICQEQAFSHLGASSAETGPAPQAGGTQGTPSPAEQGCLRDVTRTTNNPDVVLLSSSFSQAGTEVIVGVGPQRARWRCIGYEDGSTAGIMSLTDEGGL